MKNRRKASIEQPKRDRNTRHIRLLIFLYIALLVLEGGLRKWVVPSLSDPLLLIREPVVLLTYLLALAKNRFPTGPFFVAGYLIIGISALVAVFFGHGHPAVVVFGIKASILHFPMVAIMAKVFDRNDVVIMGKYWLWATIPMTALIVMQFYLPQSHFVNRAVGGFEGGGFDGGALGRYRPPGTFSFVNGIVWFYTLSTAFLMTGLTQHRYYSKLLMVLAALAILVAIPVSISRMLILAAGLTFVTGIFAGSLKRGAVLRFAQIGFVGLIAVAAASQLPVFEESLKAFTTRWELSTGEDRGGVKTAIVGRILEGFTGPFVHTEGIPFLGFGLGSGTQAGARMLTGGLGYEGEWYRLIGEMGLFLGTLFILWRLVLASQLTRIAIQAFLRRNGMPLIFLSACLYNTISGQIGQSTELGFTILGIGLTLAAARKPKPAKPKPSAQAAREPEDATPPDEPSEALAQTHLSPICT